jgi:hypothetical protein
MKTYLNYIWFKLKNSWKEDHDNILFPLWIFIGVATMISGILCMQSQLTLGLILATIGVLVLLLPLPISLLIEPITEEYNKYNKWKKTVNKGETKQ